MKLICNGLDLSDAVLKVSKALSSKSPNKVLEGIKLTAKNDTLVLLATDLELTIEKTIKADILMEGETVVVGRYFVELVKKLENEEQVELCRLDDGRLQIKYSENETELQVYPIENYPVIDKDESGDYIEVSQKQFKEIVEKTVFACSIDDSRPLLKGCLFEVKEGKFSCVALDGFRMSVVKADIVCSGDFKAVVPSRTLMEITRLLDKEEENVKIILQKNSLFVKVENTVLISRLIEGEFVPYEHILPTNFSNKVVVNRAEFLNSIERASIVARNDKFNIVKFDIKEDFMNISAKAEIGNVNENINIKLSGKDLCTAFNAKYILDFLRIITDDFIVLNLNSSIDPCVLTGVNNEGFLYLVLPVRINA